MYYLTKRKDINESYDQGIVMNKLINKFSAKKLALIAASAAMLFTPPALAQYGGGGGSSPAPSSSSSGYNKAKEFSSYMDVMINYEETDDDPQLDSAVGLSVLGGFKRDGWYGFEFGLGQKKDDDAKVHKQSAIFNTLIYPFYNKLPNLYGKIAMGVTRYVDYPLERGTNAIADGEDDFVTVDYGGGIGYVLPLTKSEKPLSLRFEAVYVVGDRFLERESDFEDDIRAPGNFHDVQFNLGLRFPL